MGHYRDFLSSEISEYLLKKATPVAGVPDLLQLGDMGGLETTDSLKFLIQIFNEVAPALNQLLRQRVVDREFIDRRTHALHLFNKEMGFDLSDDRYQTILGLEDQNGRIVAGPLNPDYWRTQGQQPIAPLPDFLKGTHVTLFGPPDSAKMCINAMNAYHRQLKDEPAIVTELLATSDDLPKWGADDEDSKTPLRSDLVSAGENLSKCFSGELAFSDSDSGKKYELKNSHLALPIKRFPGLALSCAFLFYKGEPLPLHLYDFALHLFHNWHNEQALVFYVPKLENEEEAAYIHLMIATAERLIHEKHPEYRLGSVRLMIVLENPRAAFRTHEIMDALYPYFAGASLGWHDFLASTARLFREDPNYRIPIKADPDIVIKYIKASHELLARVVGPRGGIKVGGMYGILPLTNDLNTASFQVTIRGYIRDVITQLKRGLDGFWVAHPDFVRLGLALVAAWKIRQSGDSSKLEALVRSLLQSEYQQEVLEFINGPDIESLDANNPRYARSLIVADLKTSNKVANNDPDEIRYNVFQSLQYLADWLSGNGCVALPTHVGGVAVRVMDDLATAERSRWEVWHELHHGRFRMQDFLKIAHEELHFIRKDLSDSKKIVQVKWDERTAKWYPIAFKLMLQLMCSEKPVEFASELLLPLSVDLIRNENDPWHRLIALDPKKYALPEYVRRFNHYFEKCGHKEWAHSMAQSLCPDLKNAESQILDFSRDDINEAAFFHGDIGESKKTLDQQASNEQAKVLLSDDSLRQELRRLGDAYRDKFGMKFLISAKGRSGDDLLHALQSRLNNSLEQEIQLGREALWQITAKRFEGDASQNLKNQIETLRQKHGVNCLQVAIADLGSGIESLCFGIGPNGQALTADTHFEIASLSKTLAAALALDYFQQNEINLSTSVNALLAQTASTFRLRSAKNEPAAWADQVALSHLLSHEALNLHYVNGVPATQKMPAIRELLEGNSQYGYDPVQVISEPGFEFHYSGAGFLVLEHLLEAHSGQSIQELSQYYFKRLGISELSFDVSGASISKIAHAYDEQGQVICESRKMFPACAAGALATARGMQQFLQQLSSSFKDPYAPAPLNHDIAVSMLRGFDKGSFDFMGAKMGCGVFVGEAGINRFALHQGANDGYRALFMHCFEGPDAGRGFVALCNAELSGMRLIADVAQLLLENLDFHGIDYSKFTPHFDPSGHKNEEIVNRGYKDLIFSAFKVRKPDPIPRRGPLDVLAPYNRAVGSEIIYVSNDIFAAADNLLSPHQPVFEPELFGPQGKVMDSWESARHNSKAFEEVIFKMPHASAIHYISISTAFHFGNHVPALSVEAREGRGDWQELLPKFKLEGHSEVFLKLNQGSDQRFTQVRVKAYPDGGLTRLGLFDGDLPSNLKEKFQPPKVAQANRVSVEIPQTKKPLSIPFASSAEDCQRAFDQIQEGAEFNNASAAFGAQILSCSNQHYGPVDQVLSPYKPLHMFDGFESARSREPGHFEQFVVQLAQPRAIRRLEFDFTYFVNNNPRALRVEGLCQNVWTEIVGLCSVKAFAANTKVFKMNSNSLFSQLRVTFVPDGGVNRIRVLSLK